MELTPYQVDAITRIIDVMYEAVQIDKDNKASFYEFRGHKCGECAWMMGDGHCRQNRMGEPGTIETEYARAQNACPAFVHTENGKE